MKGLRPIPKRLLPSVMEVRVPNGEGGFDEVVRIERVRYERGEEVVDEAHRSANGGCGTVFVDAVNSKGAFAIPAGSRVSICGDEVMVAKVKRYCGFKGRVHHWELEVK